MARFPLGDRLVGAEAGRPADGALRGRTPTATETRLTAHRRGSPGASSVARPRRLLSQPEPVTKLDVRAGDGADRVRRPRLDARRPSCSRDRLALVELAGVLRRMRCRSLLATVPLLISILLVNTFLVPGRDGRASFAIGRSRRPGPACTVRAPGRAARRRLRGVGGAVRPHDAGPTTLLADLERRGLGRRPVFVIGAAIGTVPTDDRASARDHRRPAGARPRHGGWPLAPRARRLVPLAGPARPRGTDEVEERTMALEARAFTAPGGERCCARCPTLTTQRVAPLAALAIAHDRPAGRVALTRRTEPPAVTPDDSACGRYRYAGARRPVRSTEIDLRVEPGDVVGLVGANDAGKSTLCLVAAGLRPAPIGGALDGSVRIDGLETGKTAVHELAQRAGSLFQNPRRSSSGRPRTVWEEVAFGPRNLSLPRDEVVERSRCGPRGARRSSDLAERDPGRLSGGQAQLVALASVLALRPALPGPRRADEPARSGRDTRLVGDALRRRGRRPGRAPDRRAQDRPAGAAVPRGRGPRRRTDRRCAAGRRRPGGPGARRISGVAPPSRSGWRRRRRRVA